MYRNRSVRGFRASNTILSREDVLKYNRQRLFGFQPFICNAPFSSLYLDNSGRALACCMSGDFSLGDIRRQSLQEIWNGEKANQLRNDLEHFNFKRACKKCEKYIRGGNYAQAIAGSYDTVPTDRTMSFPARIDFELHNTCNLACVMCNGKNSSTYRKEIDRLPNDAIVYGDKFLNELEEFIPHLSRANFLGGEPFLIDIYYSIWERLLRLNPSCNIFIQTNGHIMNERVRKLLAKGKFSIGISFESLQRETFQNIRRHGDYDKLLRNIKVFREYCTENGTHLSFAVTPLRSTVLELCDFVTFANANKADIFFNIATEPHDMAVWTLSSERIRSIIRRIEEMDLAVPQNFVERQNRQQFDSFLIYLENCAEEALSREEQIRESVGLSRRELIGVIQDKIDALVLQETEQNAEYTEEYRSERAMMFRTLEAMDQDRYEDKLRMWAVISAERITNDLAKLPLNKEPYLAARNGW